MDKLDNLENTETRKSKRKPKPISRLNYSSHNNQSTNKTVPKGLLDILKKQKTKESNKVQSGVYLSGEEPNKRDSGTDKLFVSLEKSRFFEDSNLESSSSDPEPDQLSKLSEQKTSRSTNNQAAKMGDQANMEKVFQMITENNQKMMETMVKKMAEMMNNPQQSASTQSVGDKEILHSNTRLNQREAQKIHNWITNAMQFDTSLTKMPTDCAKISDLTLIKSVISWIRKSGTGLSDHQKYLMMCIESIPSFGSLKNKPEENNPSFLARVINWVDIEMSEENSKSNTSETSVKSMINDVKIAMISNKPSTSFQNIQPFSGYARPVKHYDKNSKNSENRSYAPKPCFSWNDGECKNGGKPNCAFMHVCTLCWKKSRICRKKRVVCEGEGPEAESEGE